MFEGLFKIGRSVFLAARDEIERRGVMVGDLRYKEFFRSLPIGLYRSTVDGRFLDVNGTLTKMLGYASEDELMQIPVADVYWDESERRNWARLLGERGVVHDFETRLRRKDGSEIWVRENCRAVRSRSGHVVFYEGSVEDITERRRAEQALMESEERYRSLIERQGEGLALVDPEERIVFCNEVTGEIFGDAPGNLVGRHLGDFVDLEGYRILQEETERRRRGERSTYRLTIMRPDGTMRRVQVTSTPWTDSKGRFAGAFGIMRDVTEEERAIEALRRSEEKFRAVVTQSADAIFLVDTETLKVIEANPALSRLLGYREEELEELTLFDFVAHDQKDILEKIEQVRSEGNAYLGERIYRCRDGSEVAVEVTVSIIHYADREVMAVVSRDVTERKRAEETIRRNEDQIRRMQMLELVGRLAGGVAHDFNNVMAGILGYCQLLLRKDKSLTPDVRKAVEGIQSTAERAAGLTRQLLAFSRRQTMRAAIVDLSELVDGLMDLFVRLVGENITIETDYGPGLHRVLVDPGQFEQVVLNLVLNAKDAMPDGGTIRIRLWSETLSEEDADKVPMAKPGDYVCLDVSDEGMGIPEEQVERIFEPFFTTKEQGKGTGLGLSTVYGIVQQHGGWVDVKSLVGAGTRFVVHLPRGLADALADNSNDGKEGLSSDTDGRAALSRPIVSSGDRVESEKGARTWVLVADPQEDERSRLVSWLREKGFAVVEAADGREAESCVETLSSDIDVIIADRTLPQIDRLLDSLGGDLAVSRLVLASWEPRREEDVAEGSSVVGKPYRKQHIIELIEGLLSTEGSRETTSERKGDAPFGDSMSHRVS